MWNEIISHSVGGLRNHTSFFSHLASSISNTWIFGTFFFFYPSFLFLATFLSHFPRTTLSFFTNPPSQKNCSCSLSFLVVTSTSLLAARRCWIFSFASSFLLAQCGPSSRSLLYPIDILYATSEMASKAPRTVPWRQAVALAEDWQMIELLLHLVGVVVAHRDGGWWGGAGGVQGVERSKTRRWGGLISKLSSLNGVTFDARRCARKIARFPWEKLPRPCDTLCIKVGMCTHKYTRPNELTSGEGTEEVGCS